jgi:hypothetical protein
MFFGVAITYENTLCMYREYLPQQYGRSFGKEAFDRQIRR